MTRRSTPRISRGAASASPPGTTSAGSAIDSPAAGAAFAPVLALHVPFDLLLLSPNRIPYLHWARARELKRRSALLLEESLRGQIVPPLAPPVGVRLLVRRGRRIDDDTAIAAFKWMRDRLCSLLGFPSDSPKYLRILGVDYDCGKAYKEQPHVVVLLGPLAESTG